jgi:hypothetical protein
MPYSVVINNGAKTMSTRFSQKSLRAHLWNRITAIADNNGFDRNNGTAQLRRGDMDSAIDYGRMMALESLLNELDDWSFFRGLDSPQSDPQQAD